LLLTTLIKNVFLYLISNFNKITKTKKEKISNNAFIVIPNVETVIFSIENRFRKRSIRLYFYSGYNTFNLDAGRIISFI